MTPHVHPRKSLSADVAQALLPAASRLISTHCRTVNQPALSLQSLPREGALTLARSIRQCRNGILIFCLLSMPLYAQTDSRVVLRSDTRLVEIDLTVRDSAGKAVENLQQRDF